MIGLAGVAGLVLAVAAVALAHGTASIKLKAVLAAGQEVPTVKTRGGSGAFVASLSGTTLSWKLTFRKLSGPAVAAHIHLGRPGKAGQVVVSLCGPCTSGVSGKTALTSAQVKAILGGGIYVNVHTAMNTNGEIRGQVSKIGISSTVLPVAPAPSTTTPTTPTPPTTTTPKYTY